MFCSTIPCAIIVVKLSIIVLYVLVNVAFIAVLGPEDIRESSAVAMVTITYFNHDDYYSYYEPQA